MSGRELETVEVIYQTESASGLCVREVEDGPDIWLPLSEIEFSAKGGSEPDRGDVIAVEAPEWLLADRGLI